MSDAPGCCGDAFDEFGAAAAGAPLAAQPSLMLAPMPEEGAAPEEPQLLGRPLFVWDPAAAGACGLAGLQG